MNQNIKNMLEDAAIKVQEYKQSLLTMAEDTLINEFPKKILELNELLNTPIFKKSCLERDLHITPADNTICQTSQYGSGDNRKTSSSSSSSSSSSVCVPSNKLISEIIDIIRPTLSKLSENLILLKMWVAFLIPKIEDGNNFGVEIQEKILASICSMEQDVLIYTDQIPSYYAIRGRLVSKVVKYPFIEDYRRAVAELDENEYIKFCTILNEVRNRYTSVHDLILKNLKKLKSPRPAASGNDFC